MRSILRSLPAAFRRRGLRIAATLVLRAVLNLAGLAALLPVLTLVLDPAGFEGDGPLATVYVWSGVASPRTFALAVCGAVVGFIVLKCGVNFLLARAERRYIYDLYRTLSRRLYIAYHDRGLAFINNSNSSVLARNVNVVCLAFAAGVLRPAAAMIAEAMLFVLLFASLALYTPLAALLSVVIFLPAVWLYYALVRNRINRYGEQENRAQREKSRLVAETFRGYADIELSDAFPGMLRAFDRTMDEVVRTRSREADIGQLPQLFTEIGLAVGMALLAAVSFGGGQSQLLFGVFAVAALRLMPSVRGIMSGWATIRYNRYTIPILREAALHEPAFRAPRGHDARNAALRARNLGPQPLVQLHRREPGTFPRPHADHPQGRTHRHPRGVGRRQDYPFQPPAGLYEPTSGRNRRRRHRPSPPQTAGHGNASVMSRSVCSSPTEHSRPTSHRASRTPKSTAGGSPKPSKRPSWANSSLRCPWGSTPPSANAAAALGRTAAAHRHRTPSTAAPTYFLRRGDLGARQPHRRGDQPFDRRDRRTESGPYAAGDRPPRNLARILRPNHNAGKIR